MPHSQAVAPDAQCSEQTARDLTAQLRQVADQLGQQLDVFQNLITEAYTRRVWVPLGYSSWDTYVAGELPALPRLARAERRELVAALTDAGLSTRAITPAIGANRRTVMADQQLVHSAPVADDTVAHDTAAADQHSTVGNPTVAHNTITHDTEPDIVDAEIVEDAPEPPPAITGLNGKTYSRQPRDIPPVKTRRSPLIDDVSRVIVQMDKLADRLRELSHDDRFPSVTEQIHGRHRNELTHINDVINDVLARLP